MIAICGPGYRVYFSETLDNTIILLLVGGDKSSQKSDIDHARHLLAELTLQRDASTHMQRTRP